MQVVIDSGAVTSTNTALTLAGGASTFGSGNSSTNITNIAPAYTLDTLTADLKRGAAEVITGVTNGTTVMKLEPAGQYVVFQHKDASILGTVGAYGGTIRTGLGITSTGILGGYNRTSDGAWQTTFAIESSTGNLTLLGELRASSVVNVGAFLGSQTVSSVLTDVSTASSNASTAIANATTALANANTAIADAAAAQADADAAIAALPAKLESTSSYILTGAVGIQNTGGISVGTLTWNSTTGVITGGSGIAITEYGLVGAQAGVAKFYIDSAGNAVFAGSLSAATGTFAGTLSAAGGTFTGTLSAANGTFTGTLSSVNGTFTGSLVAASGTFTGDITGASNIDITGSGTFNGLTSVPGSAFASVKANTSNNAKYGVYAESNASSGAGLIGVSNNTSSSQANAIYGSMANPNSASIYGYNYAATGGFGIQGQATSNTSFGVLGGGNTGVSGGGTYGPGVKGLGLLSGYGLECINGFRWGSYTMSQPTGSSSDVLKGDGSWGAVSFATNATNATNATYADYLGGVIASSWARIFATNSGNANAGGSGINILGSTSTGIVGAYVGTSGTSNIVTIDVRTTSPSDVRLKEEIADSDLGLAFVKQLRPVSYKLKADPKHQKGYGFIADEVDQIIATGSSLVYYEEDWKVGDEKGFKTIHYPSYIAVLTKAIQELSAKVAVLESK
jgi:hypothetical protein